MALAFALSATPTSAQVRAPSLSLEQPSESRSLLRNGWLLYNSSPVSNEHRFEAFFLRNRSPIPANSYLTMRPALIYGLERYELTRMQTAMSGLSMGATAGLFVGALGETFGLWDESTSWGVVGALGILGAVLGGTAGYDDANFRVRYRWDDDTSR